jgi:hypothetical protein
MYQKNKKARSEILAFIFRKEVNFVIKEASRG